MTTPPRSGPTESGLLVDTVLLDIDGVLVDVSHSYRRAIVDTVDRIYGETIPRDAVQAFKNAGGFNNDWELTDAVALFVLAARNGYPTDLDAFTGAIRNAGGGLSAAQSVLERGCNEYDAVVAAWDPDRIRTVFQQLYLGAELYRRFEDATPTIQSEGYIHDEPVLITSETIAALHEGFRIGVVTGRPAREADLALDRVGLSIPEDQRVTMTDATPGKPAPDGLLLLADRLDAASVVFVGDTIDDIVAAVTANSRDADRSYYGVGVLTGGLTGPGGEQAFMDAGATAVIDTVNDIPRLLTHG